jgi:WD40 repeat protein
MFLGGVTMMKLIKLLILCLLFGLLNGYSVISVLAQPENPEEILVIAWSPDASQIASGNGMGVIRIHDVQTGQILLTLQASAVFISDLAWDSDGTRLASAGPDGSTSGT